MVSAHSQKGLSLLGWLALLAVLAFFASAAFKMLPHYTDYMAMEKAITGVESGKGGEEVRSVSEFYTHVDKAMRVNGIRDIDLNDALDVKLENNEFRVHLKYEKREPLISNLDLVARFDKEFRVRLP